MNSHIELKSGRVTLIWVVLALMAASGCSLRRLAIQNADWLAMRSLNGYVDLSSEQEATFKPLVQSHIQWAKETQLPHVRQLLQEAENRLSGKVTETDLAHLAGVTYRLREDIGNRLSPDAARLAATLTPAQIDSFEKKLRETNEPIEKRLSLAERELTEAQSKKTIELAEMLVGDLSDDQKIVLLNLYPPEREGLARHLTSRQNLHKKFIALLRSNKSTAELEVLFLSWAKEPYLMRDDTRETWELRELRRNQKFAAFISILNEKQIKYLKKEISGLIKDLQ